MEYKVVSAYVYKCEGWFSKKSDKAQVTVIHCKAKNCEIRDKGGCIHLGFATCCIYGKQSVSRGYTPRSRNFHKWIETQEEKYKGVPSLKSWDGGMAEVGEYIYLPYSQLSTKFETKAYLQRAEDKYIEKDKFTADFIFELTKFQPYAMMGGRIKSYTTKEVPRMLSHLKERYSELFKELIDKHPDVLEYLPKSNIDRKAYLSTLKKGCTVVEDDHEFIFDGTYLTCKEYEHGFMPFSGKSIDCKILPKENMVVAITHESQVDENTRFK